jgi:pilus assembly protein Flp/PilA
MSRDGLGRNRGLDHFVLTSFSGEFTPVKFVSSRVWRFLDDESGPTAVEYAVMLALILVACITIVTTLGTSSSRTFSRVNGALSS